MIFAVLATGPSMSQAVADSVRGRCKVVAVSDSWQLAPLADALVSSDAAWWRHKAPTFEGPRYTLGTFPDVEKLTEIPMGTNSGLLGIHVAVKLGATKVLMLGFDMHGDHYFGPHTGILKNTPAHRRQQFHQQFANYRPKGIEILNCTEGSKLASYPMARLEDHLEGMAELAASDSRADGGIQSRPIRAGLRSPTRGNFRARTGRHSGVVEQDKGGREGGGCV